MRTIGIVTVARSDYGLYLPVLRRLQGDPSVQMQLYVSGMHLAPEFGMTVTEIEKDGFVIAERIPTLSTLDSPLAIAQAISAGVSGFGNAFDCSRPDILVVLGDRFEMYAAAVAALPFKIPVAHIHGGELTQGAIDDALRHSMTKLSHLHFVATQEYARRVSQLGEEPWRITVSGAPGLDNLTFIRLLTRKELETSLGFVLEPTFLLVTFHPVSLQYEQTAWQCGELLAALEMFGMQIIFTLPNADTGGRVATRLIKEYVSKHSSAQLVENLGTQCYFSLMEYAAAMVGNSSSGLIEAPSFGLPVVNIGSRQAGRVRGANVIDVADGRENILTGIRKALTLEFKNGLTNKLNPYDAGRAASDVIVEKLKSVKLGEHLLLKKFCDLFKNEN